MIKAIFKILGYVSVVASFAGTIWVAALAIDDIKDSLRGVIERQDNMNTQIAEQNKNILIIIDSSAFISERMRSNTTTLKAIRISYTRHLIDSPLTKEEFVEYMEGIEMELKKNEKNSVR